MRKVLIIIIDACTARVFGPALHTGRLPNFRRLASAGSLTLNCVSVFPSVTPAATAALITGHYPAVHGIAGASWVDDASGRIVYYGDDFWIIVREGMGTFFEEFLVGLNQRRLKAPTLFQLVERAGLKSACLNYLVFRGDTTHGVRVPFPLVLLCQIRSSTFFSFSIQSK